MALQAFSLHGYDTGASPKNCLQLPSLFGISMYFEEPFKLVCFKFDYGDIGNEDRHIQRNMFV